jgi:hypothetical protein
MGFLPFILLDTALAVQDMILRVNFHLCRIYRPCSTWNPVATLTRMRSRALIYIMPTLVLPIVLPMSTLDPTLRLVPGLIRFPLSLTIPILNNTPKTYRWYSMFCIVLHYPNERGQGVTTFMNLPVLMAILMDTVDTKPHWGHILPVLTQSTQEHLDAFANTWGQ